MRKGSLGKLTALFEELGFADHGYIINNKKDALALYEISNNEERTEYEKCSGKICYPTRKAALGSKKNRRKKANMRLRIYFCEKCKKFHLTSKIERKTNDRRNRRRNIRS